MRRHTCWATRAGAYVHHSQELRPRATPLPTCPRPPLPQVRSKATGVTLPGLKHSRFSFDTEKDVLGITQSGCRRGAEGAGRCSLQGAGS